jgi:hypothetical protein
MKSLLYMVHLHTDGMKKPIALYATGTTHSFSTMPHIEKAAHEIPL